MTTLDATHGEFSHRLPDVLPGSQAVLFTVTNTNFPQWSATDIAVQSLVTGERKILIRGGADGRYVATGHLVFMRVGTLMAVPFDVEKLELTGDPVAVTSGVMQANHYGSLPLDSGAGQFSISQSGRFAYLPGGLIQYSDRSVLWVDRSGAERPLAGCPPRTYSSVTLSPDGQRFAFGTLHLGDRNIWVSDVANCGVTRLTDDGSSEGPLWTPDGKRIVFTTIQGSRSELKLKPVEGGSTERLVARSSAVYAQSWTPDGSALAFTEFQQQTNNDIWIVPLSDDRQPVPILTGRFLRTMLSFLPMHAGWPTC